MRPVVADVVLLVHLGVVLFVVGGLVVIPLGNAARWRWVNSRAFRWTHLLAIGFVVVQSWLGAVCPLTTFESWLRLQSGQVGYGSGFVQHWAHRLLLHGAPAWVFTACYNAFGVLAALAWWRYPPCRAA